MKKHLLFFILLGLVSFAYPAKAQENEVTQLQNEIKRLKASIPKVEKTYIDSVRNEYIQLIQENGSLEEAIQPTIDSLKKENLELKSYKAQVEPLVAKQLQKMAASDYKKWMGKTYAEIQAEEIEFDKELELYENFKDTDKGVASAYDILKPFKDDYSLYQQGLEAVNSPYEKATVRNLVDEIGKLSQREKHQGRKKELDNLLDQLRDYRITVLYCQEDIIGAVDKILGKKTSDKKAWKEIKSFLDNKDGGMVKTYMDKIPWLGEQYDEYLKQLEAHPYDTNTARETIMRLKP